MNPLVSILITTYCRTKNLEECLFSAINQDYNNYEIIVLNDCGKQKLHIDNNKVKIVNLDQRFETLGEKRNYLISISNGQYITLLDDDDLIMPHRLSKHIKNILKNNLETSFSKNCIFWEREIKKTSLGFASIDLVFRRNNLIKFVHNNNNSDQIFAGELRKKTKFNILDDNSYIYCWNNGVYHMSGNEIIENFLNYHDEQLKNNLEPIGDIEIIPQLKDDAKFLLGL